MSIYLQERVQKWHRVIQVWQLLAWKMEKHGLRYTFPGCRIPVSKSSHRLSTTTTTQKKKKKKEASSYRKTWKTKTPHFDYYFYFKLASFLLGWWRFADATRNATRHSLNWGKSSQIIQLLGMQVPVYKSSPPPLTGVQQVVILAKSGERFTSCITATSCGNTSQRKEEKNRQYPKGNREGTCLLITFIQIFPANTHNTLLPLSV